METSKHQCDIKTYKDVVNKIENSRRFGNDYGVTITKKVLEKLSNPQKNLKFIHIAGTNGKGSTASVVSNILMESGLKVGLFTSPHLIEFEERIRINGKYISKEDVARLGKLLIDTDFQVGLTMFDYCLVMAILYFKEQQVDVAVIETGLGGTYDSTNAIGTPLVCGITKIGYDHMQILGNTLAEIASSKAGIFKEDTSVVSQMQESEALEVLKTAAKEKKVKEFDIVNNVDIEEIKNYKRTMIGEYQLENIATAKKICQKVFERIDFPAKDNIKIDNAIKRGIANATWEGRMEILQKEPFFMIDGAHNSNGVEALCDSLRNLYPGEKFHFIMGVLADKDYEGMVKLLAPLAIDFKTITPDSSRALQNENLKNYINELGINACTLNEIRDIKNNLLDDAKNIALGSLYFIGDIKKLW
ncbi:bifunctional folylpolyglutamate synthase/dihydrofolate synthase [Lachnobacterium bovis]|uniref:bifunctional folylpolyglutamate synthase/dihydrofolate synthase n=1 Tax=Lachnobacterium bovis TaxID=140626 RepID=UPI0006906987|nr:folylpolyglutamate synthase/dihydrofolate synthase family protein [Lachnobacterium bovis]